MRTGARGGPGHRGRARPALDRIGDCVSAFVDRALRGEGLAYAVIVEPMDPGVDQVRLEARAALAGVFADLITEGMATGELPPQDARLRGAAIVGAFLESVAGPLASRARPGPGSTGPGSTGAVARTGPRGHRGRDRRVLPVRRRRPP